MSEQRKPINFSELSLLANHCQQFVGLPLQDVTLLGTQLYFCFFAGEPLFLAVDLNVTSPFCAVLRRKPRARDKKPLVLFLSANAKGKALTEISMVEELGRVMKIEFEEVEVLLQLVPRAVNVLVRAGDKQISWKKVRELRAGPTVQTAQVSRSIKELEEQFFQKGQVKKDIKTDREAEKKKKIAKLKSAVKKIAQEIAKKNQLQWRQAGDWIKANWSLEVPSELARYVERDLDIAGNVARCFEKAKENLNKLQSANHRMVDLQNQIEAFERGDLKLEKQRSLLQDANVKGRTLQTGKGFRAYYGKNAADNLRLLRRAKPWDLWVHLRDYPSSHAIICSERQQKVDDESIREVARWLVRETFSAGRFSGEKLDFLVVPCRYVRPIKGAGVGRVQFQNERVLTVQV